MKLSALLPELLPQYAFRVENEQAFSTLGLVVSPVEEPFCAFVENEKALYTIGDNAVIGSNVTIVNRVIISEGTEIRSGVVIGHDDSISYTEDAHHNKFPIRHFGGVWIGRNVMIGENSTVCRGTLDDTYIGDGVRLDALTQVSHNCRFEKNSVAVGGCRFFGSVTVEEGAYLVGALVRNQCRIGKEAVVGMGAVVIKNVENNQTVVGNPARPFVKKEG